MKTKIIPFDIETAKKIQEGKTIGLILTRNGKTVRIIAFDRKDESNMYPIVALVEKRSTYEAVYVYKPDGTIYQTEETDRDLVLEVRDPGYDFKPYDRVLVRMGESDEWKADFFSNISEKGFAVASALEWGECIPFEGNEKLLGTTNEPN